MGTNEYGVTIGNEAVYTTENCAKKGGLLGMDLLRLGLERAKTSSEALEIIIDLLELYGQGRNHGFRYKAYYHNSYLIADKKEAWILETAGKYWIAEKVKKIRSISNSIFIRGSGDLHHPELIEHAISKGWCKNSQKFDFFKHYLKKRSVTQFFVKGVKRCNCTTTLLNQNIGSIDEKIMMNILRQHFPEKINWNPANNACWHSLCVHAKNIINRSNSTISMVSEIGDEIQTHWITGTSSTCISIFKPFFLPGGISEIKPQTTKFFDQKNLWWKHEFLHRLILLDYTNRLKAIQTDKDSLEDSFINETQKILKELSKNQKNKNYKEIVGKKLMQFSAKKLNEAMRLEDKMIEKVKNLPIKNKPNIFYRKY